MLILRDEARKGQDHHNMSHGTRAATGQRSGITGKKDIKYYFVTSLMQTSDVLVVAVPNIKQKTYNLTPRMHTGTTRTK